MTKISNSKVIGAFLGTIVEYYDYSLYGFSAAIIAEKFFPASEPLVNLTNVFAVYAFAYVSKPLGSILFGRIGDIYGRKEALSVTIIGIALPTTIIGILPEYSSIGIKSTIILIICRFLQSIFVAGEYDGAAIYVIEHLDPKYRATASAITRSTGALGLLIGVGATNFFNAHIFSSWGWRIPFLISLPLSLLTLYYRRKLEETPVFEQLNCRERATISLKKLTIKHWQNILVVIFFAGGFGVTYQVSIIFMKQYLPMILPAAKLIISSFSVLLVFCFGLAMLLSGFLADRYGLMRVISYGFIGTIVSCISLITAAKFQMLNLSLVSCIMLAFFVAPFNALAHGIITKAFPVQERYFCTSIGHNIGSLLMSGTANYVCLQMMQILEYDLFPVMYIMLFALISYYASRIFERKTIT